MHTLTTIDIPSWPIVAGLALALLFVGAHTLVALRLYRNGGAILLISLGVGWVAYQAYQSSQAPLSLAQMRTVVRALSEAGDPTTFIALQQALKASSDATLHRGQARELLDMLVAHRSAAPTAADRAKLLTLRQAVLGITVTPATPQ